MAREDKVHFPGGCQQLVIFLFVSYLVFVANFGITAASCTVEMATGPLSGPSTPRAVITPGQNLLRDGEDVQENEPPQREPYRFGNCLVKLRGFACQSRCLSFCPTPFLLVAGNFHLQHLECDVQFCLLCLSEFCLPLTFPSVNASSSNPSYLLVLFSCFLYC